MPEPQLTPIETLYKGYRFRSRLEARWAVFFDTLGIRWEYEKEGFALGDAGWYLPDFWLPDYEYWIEIKGAQITKPDQRKVAALARLSGQPVFVFVGNIGVPILEWHDDRVVLAEGSSALVATSDRRLWGHSGMCVMWVGCPTCLALDIVGTLPDGTCTHSLPPCACPAPQEVMADTPALVRAYDAARGARFERGMRITMRAR